ncbi:MAG: lytic transglycosylase domain-containing protein [Coriobacteriia bacterium]|nr:lytic transglycosylase domain-containing protein [Coriobacteriia bacterium]
MPAFNHREKGRADALATTRWVILGVIGLLALVTLLFLRGPEPWQRRYYQLDHREAIAAASARHKVSPFLIAAVVEAESDWDPSAQSAVGAVGLMQVMPSTAAELAQRGVVDEARFSPDDLEDPATNLEYGSAYLRYLIERYHEIEPALAAYNAGLANADVWAKGGGDIRERIEFPATRHFVLKVSRAKDRYEALYPEAFEGWKPGE